MKHRHLKTMAFCAFFGWCAFFLWAVPVRGQGISEPDLVMFGKVVNVVSNANLREGYGTLTWEFQPVGGGRPITASTTLTNIGNQFSYVLHIPCETPVFGYAASSNTIQLTPAGITFNRAYATWNGTNLASLVQPAQTNTTFFSTDRGRIEEVDLNVSSPLVIDPYNNLPVDWELTYFGHTGLDPNSDPDHDGMTVFNEYRTGADPNDPSSELRFTEITLLPGTTPETRLKWRSADYRFYALQRATVPRGPFVDIARSIPGTAPTNTYIDATPPGSGPYYYRLRMDDTWSGATIAPLKLTSIQRTRTGILINWLSTANQTYALQRSSNLRSGFVDIATGITAAPPTNSYVDLNANSTGQFFYRLRLQQ